MVPISQRNVRKMGEVWRLDRTSFFRRNVSGGNLGRKLWRGSKHELKKKKPKLEKKW